MNALGAIFDLHSPTVGMCHIFIVMLVSGAAGGLVNFFVSDEDKEKKMTWWQHVFVGIVAAFVVPLFLSMASGGLLESIQGTATKPAEPLKLFVLAGFCLVAATSSRAFITSLSARVLDQVRSAKQQAAAADKKATEAQEAVAPFVETVSPDSEEAASVELQEAQIADNPSLSDIERGVLRALASPRYSLRSLTGVARDAKLSPARTRALLEALEAKGLVSQVISNDKAHWRLTSLAGSGFS